MRNKLYIYSTCCDSSVEACHRKQVNVEFNQVSVTFGKKDILRSVYGAASPAQILAVLGPSGTTTRSISLVSPIGYKF